MRTTDIFGCFAAEITPAALKPLILDAKLQGASGLLLVAGGLTVARVMHYYKPIVTKTLGGVDYVGAVCWVRADADPLEA